ncbi:hypothetical protein D9M68_929710 [compost metagenome]
MGFPGGRYITSHGVGRQVEYVSVSACTKQNGVAEITFQLTGGEVTGNNAPGFAINDHHVQHFMARVHFHGA